MSFVIIGICQPNHDLAFKPKSIRAPANNEHAICSPEETRTSYSDFSKLLLIFFDFLIKLSVVPLMAEDTTITLLFWSRYFLTNFATFIILSQLHTEVPPKFSKLAEEWWNPLGKFKPLHEFNPIRIQYIKQNIIEHFNITNLEKPLMNLSLLDVGCGGGLLSEPMDILGAKVTGIDAAENNIRIAKIHAKKIN